MNIEVYMNEAVFRRFTMFDILQRRKQWRSPVLFTGILSFCACICFAFHRKDGAVMLGIVLLAVGVGLSLIYALNFLLSLNKRILDLHLKTPQLVYTLCLTSEPNGIGVDNGREHACYSWAQIYHAYRDANATYLYITPNRAFLLPHDCIPEGSDALWQLLQQNLTSNQCTVLRR